MVFYLHVKFEIDWSNGFQVRVRKPHPDRRADGRRTHQSNRRIGYTQPAQKRLKLYTGQKYKIRQQRFQFLNKTHTYSDFILSSYTTRMDEALHIEL